VTGLRAHGHKQAIPLESPEKLAPLVKSLARSGDYVVCLGAGSITQWAYALPAELKSL
jgi:UDP-N-acetylmuramate--alanine ligase